MEAGWFPPPHWQPDPSWPPAPAGWQFFLESPSPADQFAPSNEAPTGDHHHENHRRGSTSPRESSGADEQRPFKTNRRIKGAAIGLVIGIVAAVAWWQLASTPRPAETASIVGTANVNGQSLAVNGKSDCSEGDNGTYFVSANSDGASMTVALYPESLWVKWISIASASVGVSYYFELTEGAAEASKSGKTYSVSGNFVENDNEAMDVDVAITCP